MEWGLGIHPYRRNEHGVIDKCELTNRLESSVSVGDVIYYEDECIFEITDFDIAGQVIVKDGTKLF